MIVKELHLVAAVVIVAFIGSVLVVQRLEARTDAALRKSQVEGCQRQVARVAILAAGWEASKSPNAKAVRQALIETVRPPVGLKLGDERMFEVVKITYPDGREKIELTPESFDLLKMGCERAYPEP